MHKSSHEHKTSNYKILDNLWLILVIFFSIAGAILGIYYYSSFEHENIFAGAYTTFQVFLLHHPFHGELPWSIELARWSLFAVFLLFSWKLILTILLPKWWDLKHIKWFYKNHIVICELNRNTIFLATKRYKDCRLVVIDNDENNPLKSSLLATGAKLITGNANDYKSLEYANIQAAEQVFINTNDDNDNENVEIADKVNELVKQKYTGNSSCKCYVFIHDLTYKRVLHNSTLFNQETRLKIGKYDGEFDIRLINTAEIGVKLELLRYLPLIFNKPKLHYLAVGLNDRSIAFIENIAHFYNINFLEATYSSNIKITIIEPNEMTIRKFKASYDFLNKFIDIAYIQSGISILLSNDLANLAPTCCIVCVDNENEIKTAMTLWNTYKINEPPILIFTNSHNKFADTFSLENRNIYVINLLEGKYSFAQPFNEEIDRLAAACHERWIISSNKAIQYKNLSEHFKNSNRSQAIDAYYKMFFMGLIDIDGNRVTFRKKELSSAKQEALARIEHRRWMIEKYIDGWTYAEKRNNTKKQHNSLVSWEKLDETEKNKDYDTVNFICNLLKDGNIDIQY